MSGIKSLVLKLWGMGKKCIMTLCVDINYINRGDPAMFKKLAGKLFGKDTSGPSSDGFFLRVRCNECREDFNLYINKSYELMQNFETDGRVTYTLRKEIFGVGCNNRILVNMSFDSSKRLVSQEIENGAFIDKEL